MKKKSKGKRFLKTNSVTKDIVSDMKVFSLERNKRFWNKTGKTPGLFMDWN